MTIDYAIINTGGKQYRVREGDTVSVETLDGEIGSDFIFAVSYTQLRAHEK